MFFYWFYSFSFKCNILYRYAKVINDTAADLKLSQAEEAVTMDATINVDAEVRLYKLRIKCTHSLKAPDFFNRFAFT